MNKEWIVIDDFSPGIHGDYHGGVQVANLPNGSIVRNGAATIENTYRCCADMSGALVPLPARVTSGVQPLTGIATQGTATPAFFPAANQAIYLMDALVGTKFTDNITPPTGSTDGESVAVAYAMSYSVAGTGVYGEFYLGRIYRQWQTGSPFWDFYFGLGNIQPPPVNSLPNMVLAWARHGATTPTQHLALSVYPSNPLAAMRGGGISAAAQLLTTFETDNTNGANYVQYISGGTFFPGVVTWPAAAASGTRTSEALWPISSANPKCVAFLGHQGRLVGERIFLRDFGSATEEWMTDSVMYSPPNTLGSTATRAVYGEENMSGTGFMASLSADELLIVKNAGGGFLIRGDMSNPTVVKLPYIESTYGIRVNPVVTPMGLVYATRNGIFSFAGGDTSKKLSTQIDGFFFQHQLDPTNEKYTGFRGRMEWWHPWVMVPNNYMFDTRTGGWWRLDSTTIPYNIYQVVPTSGKLYAFPYKITTSESTIWETYDPTVLASSYLWQSQPLIESRDRLRSYQSIRIIAAPGPHTNLNQVAVVLNGIGVNGQQITTRTTTLSFTATDTDCRPVQIENQIATNFTAAYVTVSVTAIAAGGAAPKIMSIALGTTERTVSDRITT